MWDGRRDDQGEHERDREADLADRARDDRVALVLRVVPDELARDRRLFMLSDLVPREAAAADAATAWIVRRRRRRRRRFVASPVTEDARRDSSGLSRRRR